MRGSHEAHSTQKWVNLYNEILEDFKHQGICVTLDSVQSGDILFQIARDDWGLNMVGTLCQSNRSGGGKLASEDKKKMKVGTTNGSCLYQHQTLILCYAMWANNNIVKTRSNFHTAETLPEGTGVRQHRRFDGQREEKMTEVPCPRQQKHYSSTFHLINKGYGKR